MDPNLPSTLVQVALLKTRKNVLYCVNDWAFAQLIIRLTVIRTPNYCFVGFWELFERLTNTMRPYV